MFEPIQFEELNETDVREEILSPLLRELGYRSGTEHNVIRRQSLRYPHSLRGRKDAEKDPILRGKADYILEAGGKVRWTIEANAPSADFGAEDIEQAWTYASHPAVRAVYFVLSNGRSIDVFQTGLGPAAGPVLHLDYGALDTPDGYQTIRNLLSPKSVLRDYPERPIDTGPPLGPSLRSFARITNGRIRYESNTANHPALNGIQNRIADGAIERDEQGRMVAYLHTVGPTRALQESNERLGLSLFEMVSADGVLSTAPERPSIFVYDHRTTLPAGEEVLDLSTWQRFKLPLDVHVHVVATAAGVLSGRNFAGTFHTNLDFEQQMKLGLAGSFELHLA